MTEERRESRAGLLRAIEHEGAWRERYRIHDLLIRHLSALKDHDPRRSVLHRVIDDPAFALPPDTGPWSDLIGSTTCSIDSVDVGYEPGDTMPIRLQIFDGADDTVAAAYLTPEEAADVIEGLTLALTRARTPEETAARAAEQEDQGD